MSSRAVTVLMRNLAVAGISCLAVSQAGAQVTCTPNTLNHLQSGCEQLDKIFTNITLTNNNGPNASLIVGTFTGTSETAGVTANFATSWTALGGLTTTNTTHATIGYEVSVDPTFIPPDPTKFWAITSLSLAEAGAVAVFQGASVKVVEDFCLGAASFNCTSTSPNFGFIQYERDGGNGGTTTDTICFNDGASSCTPTNGSLTLTIALSGMPFQQGVQELAVQDVLTLTAPAPFRVTNLNDVSNTFGESAVPEPGTFALAGFVLTVLAVVSARRMVTAR